MKREKYQKPARGLEQPRYKKLDVDASKGINDDDDDGYRLLRPNIGLSLAILSIITKR